VRFALILLFTRFLAAQQGSIEGLILNSQTKQPLEGVHVRMLLVELAGGDARAAYGAISQRDGTFRIEGLDAGSYYVLGERRGFVQMPGAVTIAGTDGVAVKPDEKVTGYRMEMAPAAFIAGRVVDEYGDPVANANINAVAVTGATRRAYEAPVLYSTDDRGEFRIPTAPGKYFIQAVPRQMFQTPTLEIRSDGSSDAPFGPTYFPATAAKDRAVAVEAVAGGELGGVEIRLIRLKVGNVSGVVSGMPAAGGRALVMLTSVAGGSRRTSGVGPDGRFTFFRIEAGKYRLNAQFNELESAQAEITLDSGDVSGVELRLAPGEEVAGALEIAGAPADASRGCEPQIDGAAERRDGAFFHRDGRRRRQFPRGGGDSGELPGCGGGDAGGRLHRFGATRWSGGPGRILDFSRGARGSRMKVVVHTKGARVTGKVIDADGKAAQGVAYVLLTNDLTTMFSEQPARTAADGTFTLKGIRPGKYRFFAAGLLDLTANPQEAFGLMYERAPEIEIREGERLNRDATLMGRKAADAK
jgi:hypothetical protein